jgi:hypothetical protein
LKQDLDALVEHLAVGVLVEQRRAESLDLARVVAAPTPKITRPPVGMSAIA